MDGAAPTTHRRSPTQPSASRRPATPTASLQVWAGAPGDNGEQSEGAAMEVCSEHAPPAAEPMGERRTYSHRSVADSSEVPNVENCGFDPGREADTARVWASLGVGSLAVSSS